MYRIARMGKNFDDYPAFQKIPGMPIRLKHSSSINKQKVAAKAHSSRIFGVLNVQYEDSPCICTLDSYW